MRVLFTVAVLLFSFSLHADVLSFDEYSREVKKIKMLIIDVEDVLASDVRMVSSDGSETLLLSSKDKEAIKKATHAGITVVITSKCHSAGIETWACDARAQYNPRNCQNNKRDLLMDLHFKTFISEKNTAYICAEGSCLNNMKACGLIICPQNADAACKDKADYITSCRAGEGVVAEVVQAMMQANS